MEPREMENLEKVEQLVEKAGCTYAEAKDALEYSDWNLLDAIIRLEHEGKAVKSSAAYKTAEPQEAPKAGSYVEPEVIHAEEAEHIKPDEFKKESRSGYGNGSFGEDARHYGQQAAGAAKGFFGRAKEDMKPTDSYAISAIMAHLEGWTKTDTRRRLPIYGQQRVYQRTP